MIIPFHTLISIIPNFFISITTYNICSETSLNQEMISYCFVDIFSRQSCSRFRIKNISSEILHKTIVWRHFWRKMVKLVILFDYYSMTRLIFNISTEIITLLTDSTSLRVIIWNETKKMMFFLSFISLAVWGFFIHFWVCLLFYYQPFRGNLFFDGHPV